MPGITPLKGIRYPLIGEAADPTGIQTMVQDCDTVATAEDTFRQQAIRAPVAGITTAANVSVAKTTNTKLAFDTKLYDTGAGVNLGANNDRFTPPVAGLWLFTLTFAIAAGAFGCTAAEITIVLNNTVSLPNIWRYHSGNMGGNTNDLTVSGAFVLNGTTDFVVTNVWWTGSGAGPASCAPPFFYAALLARV